MTSRPRDRRRRGLVREVQRMALRVGTMQERALRSRFLYFASLAITTVVIGLGALRLQIDNRIEVWTAEETDTDTSEWSHGSERDFIAVVSRGVDLHAPEFVANDRRLTERLRSVNGVDDVESVSLVLDALGKRNYSEIGAGKRFFEGFLVSEDERTAIIRVLLTPGVQSKAVVADVRRTVAAESPGAALVGPAVFNAALNEGSRSESRRILPLALAVVFFVLAFFHRSLVAACVMVGSALLAVIWFVGFAGWLGVKLNFVTINVPVIALVVSLALSMHPYYAWRRLQRIGRTRPSLTRVAHRTLPGCFLSAFTTAIGFAALAAGPVSAVKEFGWLTAAAVLISFGVGLLTFPLVAALACFSSQSTDVVPVPDGDSIRRLVMRIRDLAPILPRAMTILGLLCALAIARVSVDHQPIDFLAEDDPLRQEYERSGDDLGGLAPLEFVVDLPQSCWTPESLRLLERTVETMRRAAGTRRAFSILDPVKLAATTYHGGGEDSYALPEHDLELQLIVAALQSSSASTKRLVDPTGRRCRVFLPLGLIGGHDLQEIRKRVQSTLDAAPDVSGTAAGIVAKVMAVQDRILTAQVRSLVLVVVGVSLLIGVLLGSRRQAYAAVLVNLFPLALVVGALGVLQQPLDLATAMVASVALGIAVDDTVHVLWLHRRLAAKAVDSVGETYSIAGPPIVTTSVVLAAGFAVLGTAGFPPVARFGTLTSVTLLLSLAFHLGVLPILLSGGRKTGAAATSRKERGWQKLTSSAQ